MGVSINGGTHKWMIYKGKSQSKMDDMGGSPISGPPQYIRFSLTNHWFWGTPNLGYIYICDDICCSPRWFFFLEARQFQGVGDGQFGAAGLGDHGQWGSMVFFFQCLDEISPRNMVNIVINDGQYMVNIWLIYGWYMVNIFLIYC